MFDLLPLFFAKTPTAGADSGGAGGAATLPGTQGNPAQSGATSDVVQIPKKEYADLLSAKGYLSSFQSNVDKRLQQYESQIQVLQTELGRTKQEKPQQKSALDQILEKPQGDDNDLFTDETNPNLLKQIARALQTDIEGKLSVQQAEIQRLNDELNKNRDDNIIASKAFHRRLNIDDAMNRKVEKLKEEYHISRDEAIEFLNAKETIIAALDDIKQAPDDAVGNSYVNLVDDIIDGVAERKNKLAEHKTTVEKAEQERNEKIKSLLEGDKKPRTQVTLNLNKLDDNQAYGLSPMRKGETREEYFYRQLTEHQNRLLEKPSAGSNRYK